MKTFILLASIGTAIIYLLFSFVEWQLNAGLWTKELRTIFVLTTTVWVVISGLIKAGMKQ